jgi:hypothetical protein
MRSTKEKLQNATRQVQDKVQQMYRSRRYNRKSALGVFLLNLVFSCMVIAAGLFIFLNIQPYIRAVELLANQALNYSLIQFVMSLPFIGWLLGTIASIATTLIGVALWGIFQFFELLPWILTRDADTLRSLIERIEEFEVLTVKPSDAPMVAALKERHNNIPIEWIAKATTYAAFAYAIDGLMNLACYPPIQGGLDACLTVAAGSQSCRCGLGQLNHRCHHPDCGRGDCQIVVLAISGIRPYEAAAA